MKGFGIGAGLLAVASLFASSVVADVDPIVIKVSMARLDCMESSF